MPIILDQNAIQDPTQSSGQSTVANQIKAVRVETAKWFNTALTGNGLRKSGLFNVDNNTIDQLYKKAFNSVGISTNKASFIHNLSDMNTSYYSETRSDKNYFVPFADVLTDGVWAGLFEENVTRESKSSSFKSLLNELKADDLKLEIPSDTALFNIMNIKSWNELSHESGFKVVVKPFVQSVKLHSSKITSAVAGANSSNVTVVDPYVFLGIAIVSDTVTDDAVVTITHQGANLTPSDNEIPLEFIQLRSTAMDSFLMNNYVGLAWKILMAQIDIFYDRAGLKYFDTQTHGINDVDRHMLDVRDIIGELSLSNALDSQANILVHQYEEQVLTIIKSLTNLAYQAKGTSNEKDLTKAIVSTIRMIVQVMDVMSHKDSELVSTDFLNTIYNAIKSSSLDQDDINTIIQESLRLLLSQRLHELQAVANSGGLYEFKPSDPTITQKYQSDQGYSVQQKRIITTTEPLVIGQAGAGSGKSHTLVGRINYMKDQGEDLSKVMVLSFTNVAAININQRFPGIRSETLANMFNKIYQNTYPSQQLSQPSTVANSLRLLNPDADFFKSQGLTPEVVGRYIERFASTLSQLDQTGFKRVNVQEVTTNLASLIQHNMDLTALLLTAVEQTTLELQPIIIHHHLMSNHGQLNVPAEYQDLNYIITDESQDISTFEYILLLELAIHHSAQLLIVGDGSQTLYEFRNSDPKYMNALESSGVFTTYKLDVNYRSRQEILTFANQFLDVIDANDIARIQLKSSNFTPPTEKSYDESITIQNIITESSKPTDYNPALVDVVQNSPDFDKWFREKIDAGEQVAILGWTRSEVIEFGKAIEEWLTKNGYNIPVTSIMSEKNRPTTIISATLTNAHSEILKMSVTNPSLRQNILNEADRVIASRYRYSSDAQKKFFISVFREALDEVMGKHQWQILKNDVRQKAMSNKSAIGYLTRELLRIETRKNAMDAYLNKAQDAPDYSNERIMLSTIHGAKGLEFDNTIVLFNQDKRGSTSQESLRMLFVALSRAKKAEYIINAQSRGSKMVTSALSGMFETPMQTAYMRGLDEIRAMPQMTGQPNP